MINYIFGTVMSMNHGLNEITVSGPIVIFRAKGAYNMAGIKEYEQEFVKLVTPLMGKPWGIWFRYTTLRRVSAVILVDFVHFRHRKNAHAGSARFHRSHLRHA